MNTDHVAHVCNDEPIKPFDVEVTRCWTCGGDMVLHVNVGVWACACGQAITADTHQALAMVGGIIALPDTSPPFYMNGFGRAVRVAVA